MSLVNNKILETFQSAEKSILDDFTNYIAVAAQENHSNKDLVAYFSNSNWGCQYLTYWHEIDPVRRLCQFSRNRFIYWNRLILTSEMQSFMERRNSICNIKQAVTINFSNENCYKIITIGSGRDDFSIESYANENILRIQKIMSEALF